MAWISQLKLFWPRLLCTGLQGPMEAGLPAILLSSSLACSLPMGATKMAQGSLQFSPHGVMAEQSGDAGPLHQSRIAGQALGAQWVPQARGLLS